MDCSSDSGISLNWLLPVIAFLVQEISNAAAIKIEEMVLIIKVFFREVNDYTKLFFESKDIKVCLCRQKMFWYPGRNWQALRLTSHAKTDQPSS
jgi:hypothetical protein